MTDDGKRQGLRWLVLKVLAIASALTFLTIVMVNACATYAAPTKPAPTKAAPVVNPQRAQPAMYAAPTKAAPVVNPSPRPPQMAAPATKSMAVVPPRPLIQPAAQAPQQQAAPAPAGVR
jgi:hypothetical protein